jgi:hypothetical protein
VAQLRDDIFLDSSCLSSQYNACSKGKLTIPEGPVEDVTITADPATSNKATLQSQAREKVSNIGFDLVMFCQPPGTTGWIAYAYINSWDSYYNDNWCRYVSGQLHEVGHNLVRRDEEASETMTNPQFIMLTLSSLHVIHFQGLGHAGEARSEYGDQSGFMGFSYSQDDQYMCFNAVNNYQLGWYDGQYSDVTAATTMGDKAFVLNGVETAGSTGAANDKKIAV